MWTNLRLLVIASSIHVHILSLDSGNLLHTFDTQSTMPRSLRCVLIGPRSKAMETTGLCSVQLCYTERVSGDCVMQTYSPPEGVDVMTLPLGKVEADSHESTENSYQRLQKRIANPGAWDMLSDGTAVGVRRRILRHGQGPMNGHEEVKGLRQRFPQKVKDTNSGKQEYWEMWTASSAHKPDADDSRPLVKAEEGPGQLIVPAIGPRVTVGLTSVAFGFGNVIKLVTVGGQQRFEAKSDATLRRPWQSAGRRRKSGGLGRVRSGS